MLTPERAKPIHAALSGAAPDGFQAVLHLVLDRFKADLGMIHWLNLADRHLELVATSAGVPEPVLAASRRIPLGKGIAGETAQSKKPVSPCNLQIDTSGVAHPGAKATGAQGSVCVPIFSGAEVVRTLGVSVRGERNFTQEETEELIDIGREIAAPLRRTRT